VTYDSVKGINPAQRGVAGIAIKLGHLTYDTVTEFLSIFLYRPFKILDVNINKCAYFRHYFLLNLLYKSLHLYQPLCLQRKRSFDD
jgi:hypothetical protein